MRLAAALLATALGLALRAGAASPPPGRLVFDDFVGLGNATQLFVARADGSHRVRITYGGGSYAQPRWSPDGRRLVAIGGPGLVVMSPNGAVLHRIATAASSFAPSWSPAGGRVAYLILSCDGPNTRGDPTCATLWVARADGRARRRLSAPAAVDASQGLQGLYSWSPDSTRIAYVRQDGIALVDATSGKTSLLGPPTKLIEQFPSWSPDGRWIFFMKQRAPFKGADLVAVHPDGSGLHRIRATASAWAPRWSPDGRRIAFLVDMPRLSEWAVVVVHPDGSARTRVGTTADDSVLLWSPDSTRLLFVAGVGTTFAVARADGRGKVLHARGGYDPDWGP